MTLETWIRKREQLVLDNWDYYVSQLPIAYDWKEEEPMKQRFITMGVEPAEGIQNWLIQKGRGSLADTEVPAEHGCLVTLAVAMEDIKKGDIILIDLCHGTARRK